MTDYSSVAWVRDLVDCFALAMTDFEKYGWENPRHHMPRLTPIMVLTEKLFLVADSELAIQEEGKLFLAMRHSPWIQALAFPGGEVDTLFRDTAAQAHEVYQNLLKGKAVTDEDVALVEAYVVAVVEDLGTWVEEYTNECREAERLADEAVDGFRQEIQAAVTPLDLELFVLLDSVAPAAAKSALQLASEAVAEMILSKEGRGEPLHLLYIDELTPDKSDQVRRYTAIGLAPFQPLPLGQDYDSEDGCPERRSDLADAIAKHLDDAPGLGACFFAAGSLIASLQDGYEWERDGIDDYIVALISNLSRRQMIVVRESSIVRPKADNGDTPDDLAGTSS